MHRALILCVTHRGLSDDTAECVQRSACPSVIKAKGLADVVFARCVGFDQALAAIQGTEIDTVLLVDDDMVFSAEDCAGVVGMSRQLGVPVSALACSADGKLNVKPYEAERLVRLGPPAASIQLWLTGLAFMAVPRALLELKADDMPKLSGVRQWTGTGEHPAFPGEWTREDFWFCLNMGGVVVAPIGVGHIKPRVLRPDAMSIAHVQGYAGEMRPVKLSH